MAPSAERLEKPEQSTRPAALDLLFEDLHAAQAHNHLVATGLARRLNDEAKYRIYALDDDMAQQVLSAADLIETVAHDGELTTSEKWRVQRTFDHRAKMLHRIQHLVRQMLKELGAEYQNRLANAGFLSDDYVVPDRPKQMAAAAGELYRRLEKSPEAREDAAIAMRYLATGRQGATVTLTNLHGGALGVDISKTAE